jgi:hypothetical protein
MNFRNAESVEALIKMSELRDDVVKETGYLTSSEQVLDKAVEIIEKKLKELLNLPLEEKDMKILLSRVKDIIDNLGQ